MRQKLIKYFDFLDILNNNGKTILLYDIQQLNQKFNLTETEAKNIIKMWLYNIKNKEDVYG